MDMSKHRNEALIERPEGGRRRRMTIMATKADYDRLATDLGEIGRPIIVGFEATGNNHRTLAHRLATEIETVGGGACPTTNGTSVCYGNYTTSADANQCCRR